jgi:sugar lactone lactonase YvrE
MIHRSTLGCLLLATWLAAAACAPAPPVAPAAGPADPAPSLRPSPPPASFGPPVFPTPRPAITPPPDVLAVPSEAPPADAPGAPGVGPSLAPPRNYDLPTLGLHLITLHGPRVAGDAAGLAAPGGVAGVTGGVVYVSDTGANLIRVSRLENGVRRCVRLAGDGRAGHADGVDLEASFKGPTGLAAAAGGRLYVADSGNHCVRLLAPHPNGGGVLVVTTVAGKAGQAGHLDGLGGEALLSNPTGLALDAAGNLYVADTGNHCLRRITPAGVVTTVAGLPGRSGHVDGDPDEARFLAPRGLVVSAAGELFVCDTGNHCLRRVSPAGRVTTYAGRPGEAGLRNGPGAEARFSSPSGLALGPDGSLWVTDDGNRRVRRVDPEGAVVTAAGLGRAGTVDGPAALAQVGGAGALAWGGGALHLVDAGERTLRELRFEHLAQTAYGLPTAGDRDGSLGDARFRAPVGVAYDREGNLYLADAGNHTLRRLDGDGRVTTVAGQAGQAGFAEGARGASRLSGPRAVVVDVDGTLYVADTENHVIRALSPGGRLTTLAGNGRAGFADGRGDAARFDRPVAIALGPEGRLYVADQNNHRVRVVTTQGEVATVAGAGTAGFRDGTGPASLFSRPAGLAVDALGRIYVSEAGNHAIRLVTRNAIGEARVRTLAGRDGQPGFRDGPEARFNEPGHVSLDAEGRLYVADSGNSLIRRIERDGTVTTYAGALGADRVSPRAGYLDGPAASALFGAPQGLVVDLLGIVHVADTQNHCVRRLY